ncbi:MAG: hypothetical protein K8R90_00705 [Candidatus Cloacimonetes bacterium]|nr:hypothetical protein [Candidatus Cloacimonadota bacterium]
MSLSDKILNEAYFRDANAWLFLGDTIDTMSRFPEESVDMVFFSCHHIRLWIEFNRGQK